MSYSLSEWGCILDGAQKQRDLLFRLIQDKLGTREPPGVSWELREKRTKTKWMGLLSAKKREFLEIRMKGVKGYSIDTSADPFGNTLAVHSSLCSDYKPELLPEKVSWEDQTVLEDWTSVVFRCIQEACTDVGQEVGTPAKLKAETRGILSIW